MSTLKWIVVFYWIFSTNWMVGMKQFVMFIVWFPPQHHQGRAKLAFTAVFVQRSLFPLKDEKFLNFCGRHIWKLPLLLSILFKCFCRICSTLTFPFKDHKKSEIFADVIYGSPQNVSAEFVQRALKVFFYRGQCFWPCTWSKIYVMKLNWSSRVVPSLNDFVSIVTK